MTVLAPLWVVPSLLLLESPRYSVGAHQASFPGAAPHSTAHLPQCILCMCITHFPIPLLLPPCPHCQAACYGMSICPRHWSQVLASGEHNSEKDEEDSRDYSSRRGETWCCRSKWTTEEPLRVVEGVQLWIHNCCQLTTMETQCAACRWSAHLYTGIYCGTHV